MIPDTSAAIRRIAELEAENDRLRGMLRTFRAAWRIGEDGLSWHGYREDLTTDFPPPGGRRSRKGDSVKRYTVTGEYGDGSTRTVEEEDGGWVRAADAEEEIRKLRDLIRSVRAATRAHTFILCKDGEARERGLALLDRMDAVLGTNAAGEPNGGKG